tara:strand:+ start:196 stop:648 length:453 start_codon:yes stop_codon:yes gene_type:complete
LNLLLLQIVTVVANDVKIISNESLIVSNGDKSSRIGGGTFALIILSLLLNAFLFLPDDVGVCNCTFCFCFSRERNDEERGGGSSRREHKKQQINLLSLLLPLVTEAQFPLEKYDADDAIFRASVMCVIFVQIFVRSFSQRKASEFSRKRV